MSLKVALVQHDIIWEDSGATLEMLNESVEAAAGAGAEMIVLSEMFATGFSMEVERTAQAEDGQIVDWMRSQAARLGVRLLGSAAILDDGAAKPANRLLVVGPEGIEARYDKRHPFSMAKEDERFAAGTEPVIASIGGMNWALSICYDLRFTDVYWDAGPDVDGYIVVSHWPTPRVEHWKALLIARAIENQAWVIGVNRVGEGGGLDHSGGSMVVDPLGRVVVVANEQSALLVTSVDETTVAAVRGRLPFLADRH